MALRLDITDQRGVTAGYHRIISVTQVYERGQAGIHINLAGYVSRAFREKEINVTSDKEVNSAEQNQSFSVTNVPVFLPFLDVENFQLSALYTRLKAEIPELSASTDVLEPVIIKEPIISK